MRGPWGGRFRSPLAFPGLVGDGLVEPLLGLGEGIPCKVDGDPESVAVHRPLRGLLGEKPAERHEVPALLVDAALGDAEDLGDPGGLDAALGVAEALLVEEATDEVSEDGGDERAAGAAGDEADDAPGDGHAPIAVGDACQGRLERFGLEVKLSRVGGELDACLRDLGEQADGQELADGVVLSPCPADESPDFQGPELRRGIVVVAAAAAAFHFGEGEIDPELLEADLGLAERGPGHDKLRDGEETESAVWFPSRSV